MLMQAVTVDLALVDSKYPVYKCTCCNINTCAYQLETWVTCQYIQLMPMFAALWSPTCAWGACLHAFMRNGLKCVRCPRTQHITCVCMYKHVCNLSAASLPSRTEVCSCDILWKRLRILCHVLNPSESF